MPTANCDWFIEAQESKGIPGQWFAAAAKGATKVHQSSLGTPMPVPEVRLHTGWKESRELAILDVEVLISRHEAGVP